MLCYGSLSVHVTQTHERDCAALSRKPVSVFLAKPEAHGIHLGLARLAAGVEAQDFLALFFADAEAIAAEVACHYASKPISANQRHAKPPGKFRDPLLRPAVTFASS
jgi:hypothetical protein